MHVDKKEVLLCVLVFLELVAFFVTCQQVSIIGENFLWFP
jgi:hypothetical protein